MASAVDICNMALSALGEDALVVSISPSDGSVQAGHCVRFYPLARTEALEAFDMAFSARRTDNLAEVESDSDAWAFAYALPANCLKVRKVLPDGETDESKGANFDVMERVLYTNEETPTLIYTTDVTDTTKFTPLFTRTVSLFLASYLAGPIKKSTDGGKSYFDAAMAAGAKAAATNANASSQLTHDEPAHWITGR
jgi:hypothetical protein